MKIVYHQLNQQTVDIAPLSTEFAPHTFIATVTPEDLEREIGDAEVLAIGSGQYGKRVVDVVKGGARKLKWIHFLTSGIDQPVRAGGFPDNVVITNSAGLRAPNLSEHIFAMLLFLNRRLRRLEAARPDRAWLRNDIWNDIVGLTGKTMVILGMGTMGQAVAIKAKAFNMKVLAVSRGYKPDATVDEVFPRERVKEALARAHVVVICIPSDPETVNFLDSDKLSVLKNAYVINESRGDVVDEKALVAALKSGAVQAAGLDVTAVEPLAADSPLWTLENVLITPHVGGAGSPDNREMVEMFAEGLRHYVKGQPLPRVVDWKAML